MTPEKKSSLDFECGAVGICSAELVPVAGRRVYLFVVHNSGAVSRTLFKDSARLRKFCRSVCKKFDVPMLDIGAANVQDLLDTGA